MKKVVKKSLSKEKNEKRDQYTVVLEDLRSNFKAFGENLGFVRNDVKSLHGELTEVRDELAEVHGEITEVRGELRGVKKTVDSHTEMIGRIMIDVEEIKSGMREKVDRAEFVKLEKRLVTLEAVVYGGKKK